MIDVIIPVYGGVSQTRTCIESVLASRQASAHEVIAISRVASTCCAGSASAVSRIR